MIYLDNCATTACREEVVAAMLPYFTEKHGNPASRTHAMGWAADEAVAIAKRHCATLINAGQSDAIIFTSGATESCNLALKGIYELFSAYGNHIITCKTEHKAVLDSCAHLEKMGARITYLDVNENGQIDLQQLQNTICEDTILIAVMYANNETGVLQPIKKIGEMAKAHKVLFFTDATQAVGKIKVDVMEDNIDLLAMSAHKINGPKGVGLLYLRRKKPRVNLIAQIDGGGHQNGFRSGTLNVPSIVGLGKAMQLLQEDTSTIERMARQRATLENALLQIEGASINGVAAPRLPNVCNIAFEGVKAERLVKLLNKTIAFSVGAACASAQQKASYVLEAMHLPQTIIDGSIRLSLGIFTSDEDIEKAVILIRDAVQQLKNEQ